MISYELFVYCLVLAFLLGIVATLVGMSYIDRWVSYIDRLHNKKNNKGEGQ
jgi:4-hydroxybenzoate polyprenyltransferase